MHKDQLINLYEKSKRLHERVTLPPALPSFFQQRRRAGSAVGIAAEVLP